MRLSESEIREVFAEIKESGWFVPPTAEPFSAGGGGSVFRCYDLKLLQGLHALAKSTASLNAAGARAGADLVSSSCAVVDSLDTGISMNRSVAVLKVPHQPDERMRREVDAMRRCPHPHLTQILAADSRPTPRWFIMEYHPKGNVEDVRERFRGKPLEVLRRFRPVVEALTVLHGAELIHRDIKPRNIFISRDDRWILGDLGIVFDANEGRLTSTQNSAIWSRDWRPDWVARRSPGDYTPAVDVFMVVKTIYALVLGDNPPASQIREPDCDLRSAFSDVPGMELVQAFVERHVTVRESRCASKNAHELLRELDALVRTLEGSADATLLFNWLATHTASAVTSNSQPSGLGPAVIYVGRRYKRLVGRARLFRNGGTSVPQGFSLQAPGRGATIESSQQGISGEFSNWTGAWTDEMTLVLPPDFRPGWFELSMPTNNTATMTGFVLYGVD